MTGVKGKSGRPKKSGNNFSRVVFAKLHPKTYYKLMLISDSENVSGNIRKAIDFYLDFNFSRREIMPKITLDKKKE